MSTPSTVVDIENNESTTKVEKKNTAAEQFREVRAALGLTQLGLAGRLSLSRNYIAKIESGDKTPSVRVLQALHALKLAFVYPGNTRNEEGLRFEEARPPYSASRSTPMTITPGHEPPASEPTEQQCQEYLAEYLRRGKPLPCWVGHTYLELRDKFPLDKPERLKREGA